MKKCKNCQKEIDSKAKKCPFCQTDLRNWFLKHPILTVILVLIVISIVSAGGKKTTTLQTGNQSNQVTSEPSPIPMKITARELVDDFDNNQVAAETKWKEKLVEFSAEITNITDSGLSFSRIPSTKDFSMAQISCRIEDKQQLLPLKNGQTVTVRGIVGTQTIGVIDVSSCVIVN